MSHRKILVGLSAVGGDGSVGGVRSEQAGRRAGWRRRCARRGREADLQAARQGLLRSRDRSAPAERSRLSRRAANPKRRTSARKRSDETCKYFFKVEGAPEAETFVQVYAPAAEGGAARAERSVLLVEEGRQGVHHRQGEVAQGGPDGGVRDRALPAGQGLLGQRERVDEGLHPDRGREARPLDEVARSGPISRASKRERELQSRTGGPSGGTVTLKFTAAIRPRM